MFGKRAYVCVELIKDRLRSIVGEVHWNKAFDELNKISRNIEDLQKESGNILLWLGHKLLDCTSHAERIDMAHYLLHVQRKGIGIRIVELVLD